MVNQAPEELGRTGGEGDLAAVSRWGKDLHGADRLAGGPEFELIRRFAGRNVSRPDVAVEIGDDAAVVKGEGIVLSSDISVEDVHFRREWMSGYDIGYRATAAALSDLAAMAARPIGVLASLAIAPEDRDFAEEVMGGVRESVEVAGGVLLGGDLSRSPGPLILDVVAVGEAAEPVHRTGAEVGDELWVTGRLGGSGLAVATLVKGEDPTPEALAAFCRPPSRHAEALWLAERGVPQAMLDLSDGIAGDAGHLAAANAVQVILDRSALPAAEGLPEDVTGLEMVLRGGEDYELLFAARPGAVEAVRDAFDARFDCELTRVGELAIGAGVWLREASGEARQLDQGGFQHFGAG